MCLVNGVSAKNLPSHPLPQPPSGKLPLLNPVDLTLSSRQFWSTWILTIKQMQIDIQGLASHDTYNRAQEAIKDLSKLD